MRFGARLRELRGQTGLSQEALAAKAGVHRTYLSGVERGERNISLANLEKLARALDVDMSTLLEGVD